MGSNASRITADYKETLPVHFLRTKNEEGDDCFFVLRASTAQFTRLLAKKNREHVDIAEYGEILASGYGRQPSKDTVTMLREKYGIELPQD